MLPDKKLGKADKASSPDSDVGRFDFDGKRALVMDVAGGLYALKKTLRGDIGLFEKDFMFRAGLEGAKVQLSSFGGGAEGEQKKDVVDHLLQLYSSRGYGEFRLERFDPEKCVMDISSPNAIEAWAFQMNNDLQMDPVCSYTCGVLTTICRLACGDAPAGDHDLIAVETECVAQGKKMCRFVVGPEKAMTKLVSKNGTPRMSSSEYALKLNDEILQKNLELQSLNLSLERQSRKRAEELRRSEDNYRAFISLSPEPILICRSDGAIEYVNEAGSRILGYDHGEQLRDVMMQDLFGREDGTWDRLIWQLEKEGVVHRFEAGFSKRDGTKLEGEVSARYADLLSGRRVEAVVRDVTEKKLMQAEVDEARSESEFLNDLLSHDIINYMMAALHHLGEVKKSADLAEKDRKNMSAVVRDIEGAFQLASAVRDLSRIKAMEEKDLEIKDLQVMIQEAMADSRQAYSEKTVTVTWERGAEPRYVKCNPLSDRIFGNILSNAIKFDPSDEVFVDIVVDNVVDEGKAFWRVRITDRGKGIADAEKDKVFDRFYRVDRSVRGTGLGLYVVKFITLSSGGRVWAEDRVKGDHTKGTAFIVLLPKAEERQVAAALKSRSQPRRRL